MTRIAERPQKHTIRAWGVFLAIAILPHAHSLCAGEAEAQPPSRVWSDIFEGRDAKPLCGMSASPLPPAYFQQGPSTEAGAGGGPGCMVVAKNGTRILSMGTALYQITVQGRVELLAGTPGLAGYRDGTPDRALFNGISVLALGEQGEIYVLEKANRCLRKVTQEKDGMWRVKTVVGSPDKKVRKDASAEEASFVNPCGMTLFDDGSIFFMDNDYLRCFKEGRLVTVNAEGGNGFSDGPLSSARFRIAYTANCLTSDGKNILYVADMWNNVLRRIDWEKQSISTVAGGPIRSDPKAAALRKGRDPFQDGIGMNAFFHPGGGISTVWYDRHASCLYMTVADDPYPHVMTADGWVRSLKHDVPVASDEEGRVYIAGKSGIGILERRSTPAQKNP